MNTLILDKKVIFFLALISLTFFNSCQKETDLFGITDLTILPVNAEKDKPKTVSQFISILYTNLFQEAIGPNRMLEAKAAIASIGDKQVAFDILVSKYMRDGGVILPTTEFMKTNTEQFIRDTYKRFLVRQPTEAELKWMMNPISPV